MIKLLTSTFNEESHDDVNTTHFDSYIKHSVAPGCIRPFTAPNRLEVHEAPSEIFHSVLELDQTDKIYTDSSTNVKPVIKRKVLR